MISFQILAFGIARDILGAATLRVELPGVATVGELRTVLGERYPALKELASWAVAVNNEYAEDTQAVQPTDEIAVIPPVSGG